MIRKTEIKDTAQIEELFKKEGGFWDKKVLDQPAQQSFDKEY